MAIRVRPEVQHIVDEGVLNIATPRPLSEALKADIRDVLSFLRGNELHMIAGAFERACIRGDVSNQYIDTRVSTKTVAAPSGTDVSRAYCAQLIDRIQQQFSEVGYTAQALADPLATAPAKASTPSLTHR